MKADYTIKARPTNNKTWKEADNIDVALTLKVENELRTFKGVVSLFGIVKE